MTISNPLDQKVSITISGKVYSVDANDTVQVAQEAGDIWLKTHQFLSEVQTRTAPVVVEKEEIKEEAVEVIEEEEVVTDKKKVIKKK